MKSTILTPSGVIKLEEELTLRTGEKRREITAAIKEAKGHGDLSENAEYDAAKDEEATNNDRIIAVQELLRNSTVVDDESSDEHLGLGGQADIKFLDTDDIVKIRLVSTVETNPDLMNISIESPLGIAIYKKALGEKCTVLAPEGNYEVSIEKIYE
ncbi:transcription elongation factor GreA [Clostridium estertheticum]|uniref:Transcription elongation factor GreA n=1 Tax=Clostridium estertheticum TaxID=238834 RepID=A0A7Y3SXU6_9CLOT|nr:transcription elongation factor GreA [Clostridium estertheticum]MBW9152681.1 transcription elongation factor GreA [Clostridium estertheticum]MBW9172028.1 transcription elongation factor GreA [Clostridium estertheticum]MBX4263378.1 transcription elongation factor GreA [Clostridium estertheticum]MBX4270866.1 transcription elongation factor GreA [Clostridium estertheticum]NNU77162.1 transcription elongation factor GreA [Clostridium estertheticum]